MYFCLSSGRTIQRSKWLEMKGGKPLFKRLQLLGEDFLPERKRLTVSRRVGWTVCAAEAPRCQTTRLALKAERLAACGTHACCKIDGRSELIFWKLPWGKGLRLYERSHRLGKRPGQQSHHPPSIFLYSIIINHHYRNIRKTGHSHSHSHTTVCLLFHSNPDIFGWHCSFGGACNAGGGGRWSARCEW